MDEKTLLAKATYETLCSALDSHEWHYDKNEDELTIECGAQGDDLPIKLSVEVDAERMLVVLLSHLPLTVKEELRLDAAIAVSVINDMLVDGSFDYNIATGQMVFRMTNSFIESVISEDVFSYMLFCSSTTIDEYNDKLLLLATGLLSIDDFLSSMISD